MSIEFILYSKVCITVSIDISESNVFSIFADSKFTMEYHKNVPFIEIRVI